MSSTPARARSAPSRLPGYGPMRSVAEPSGADWPSSRSVATYAIQRKSVPSRTPSGRPSRSGAGRPPATGLVEAARSGRRQRTVAERRLARRRSVGPKRDGVGAVSRRAASLARATAAKASPPTAVRASGDRAPSMSRRRRSGRPAPEAARDAEAAEQAGRGEGEEPRIGRLGRRQERPRPEGQELVDDADDRRHEAEERHDPEPDHRREGAGAARDRRPDDSGHGDRDRGSTVSPTSRSSGPPGR